MNSPLFQAVLFSGIALWAVLFAIKGLRRPPPGFEAKICSQCKHSNHYSRKNCEKCETPLKDPWDDEDEGSA